MDKKIKLLLLLINTKGKHLNLISKTRYSEEFGNIYTTYTLEFWYVGKRINKKTKQEEEYWYCEKEEFNSKTNLLKYLIMVRDDINE